MLYWPDGMGSLSNDDENISMEDFLASIVSRLKMRSPKSVQIQRPPNTLHIRIIKLTSDDLSLIHI